MPDTLIKHVSDTAFMVAIERAAEGERPDALFRDPLARKLAGERGEALSQCFSGGGTFGRNTMTWMMAIRTRIIDDFITSAVAEGAEAVLNLGAGLDTRPYRLDLPKSLQWIEVDYAHMIEFKNSRLSDETPRCRLERESLDLTDVPAREKLFSQIGSRFKNVLVLTEGVVPYLSVEDAARLADDLKSQSSFRRWIVDYFSSEMMRRRKRAEIQKRMKNAPFLFEPGDYYGFFKTHGWSPKEIRYLWDEGKRLGRPMPLPFIAKFWLRFTGLFQSRQRRDARRKFMAYVLFEASGGA